MLFQGCIDGFPWDHSLNGVTSIQPVADGANSLELNPLPAVGPLMILETFFPTRSSMPARHRT